MDPRKLNARRGFREREAIRRQNTSQWQSEFFPKEGKMNASFSGQKRSPIGWIVTIIVIITAACVVLAIWNPLGYQITRKLTTPPANNNAAVVPTVVPTTAPTAKVEAPVVPTVPVPVAVTCDTPSIKAGFNSADTEYGEFLDTVLGKRMTFTNRKVVVPSKAWNDPLSAEELKAVETTWLFMQVCVPEGTTGVIFAGGFEQKLNRYETGVLMTLIPGLYQFRLRNGEAVLWYPEQGSFQKADLERIVLQIRNGNFDIKSPLDFFGVTADLLPAIPADLVKERNVQIVPAPEPDLE